MSDMGKDVNEILLRDAEMANDHQNRLAYLPEARNHNISFMDQSSIPVTVTPDLMTHGYRRNTTTTNTSGAEPVELSSDSYHSDCVMNNMNIPTDNMIDRFRQMIENNAQSPNQQMQNLINFAQPNPMLFGANPLLANSLQMNAEPDHLQIINNMARNNRTVPETPEEVQACRKLAYQLMLYQAQQEQQQLLQQQEQQQNFMQYTPQGRRQMPRMKSSSSNSSGSTPRGTLNRRRKRKSTPYDSRRDSMDDEPLFDESKRKYFTPEEKEAFIKNQRVIAKALYELSDCPKRKAFLDDLFTFMAERNTPINRLPIMAKSVLDLYELYNLVIERGGLVEVINKKLWQEIIKGLRLPSSITSAAFTLRTQYMKYLYPYECVKKNLSQPCELQAAIDGNRREGRRTSYGQFDPQMQSQLHMAAAQARQVPIGLQSYPQMGQSPMMMAHPQNQQLINSLPNLYAQMKQIMPNAIDRHMMEYLTAMNANPQMAAALSGCRPSAAQLNGNQSPDQIGLGSLAEMQRNIWSLCGANNSNAAQDIAEQREAMNLSPPRADATIKRERDSVEVRDQPEDYAVPSKRLQTGNNYHNGSINGNSSKHSNSNGNGGGHHNDDDDDDDDDDMQDAPANLVVNNRQPNHGRPFNGLPSRRVSDPPSADGRNGGDAPPIHWGSIHSLVNLQVGNPIKSKNNNQISEVPVSLVINGVTFTGTLTATDIHTPETSSEDHSPQRNRDNDNNQPPPPPPPPAAPSAGVA